MFKLKNHADVAFSYAPGKVILVGEHAVVYGARAIAIPIDAGVRIAVSRINPQQENVGPSMRGVGSFFMEDVFAAKDLQGSSILKNALSYLVDAFGEQVKNLSFVVDGDLPPGRGLGSSASLSVALIRAIFRYFSWQLSEEVLYEHALELETIFHGAPSGIDHSVVIGEKVIGFRRGAQGPKLWPIELKAELKFVIGIAGPHDGTKKAVASLLERKRRHPSVHQRIFDGLDDIAAQMEEALGNGHLASVGELMNIAQGYLNALSVSTPQIENLCAIARERGALGAKLTGAGGGGAVIALVDGSEKNLMSAFRAAGYQSFVTTSF